MAYELEQQQASRSWTTRRDEKKRRLQLVSSWMSGPILPQKKLIQALELLFLQRPCAQQASGCHPIGRAREDALRRGAGAE
jgi:hypothetical protein